jgi:hypothetical protein
MDCAIKEERQYILNTIKQIKKKSIAMYYLYKNLFYVIQLVKMEILIVKNIEPDDVPFIAKVNQFD